MGAGSAAGVASEALPRAVCGLASASARLASTDLGSATSAPCTAAATMAQVSRSTTRSGVQAKRVRPSVRSAMRASGSVRGVQS
ncbi:MAG: hypothetical protein H6Q86_5686 [candidate division NC10 bacterium]|nr:hypothetical protein [candidate division NC10 bacterium]